MCKRKKIGFRVRVSVKLSGKFRVIYLSIPAAAAFTFHNKPIYIMHHNNIEYNDQTAELIYRSNLVTTFSNFNGVTFCGVGYTEFTVIS